VLATVPGPMAAVATISGALLGTITTGGIITGAVVAAGAVAVGASALIGGIAGIIQQFNSPKYLPGMCQYISNLHKEVRKDLDLSWEENKPEPVINSQYAGECSINGFQAAEIMLHSRSNYRVEAERVPFYNDTRSVSIIPS
jgi:hypothetical protein